MDYYTVIGTYAMYAYEAAAGVVFNEETMATNDVDLFLTAGKQMKFAELVTDQRRKGMKGNTGVHPNCRRTQFEKGSRPHTWLPVGSYRVVPGGSGHTTLILEKKVNDLPGPNKRAVAPGAPAGVGGR